MDWNNDGKHDYKDDAFYHNLVSDDANKKSESSNNSYCDGRDSTSSSSGAVWLLVLFIVWILSKIIGG